MSLPYFKSDTTKNEVYRERRETIFQLDRKLLTNQIILAKENLFLTRSNFFVLNNLNNFFHYDLL